MLDTCVRVATTRRYAHYEIALELFGELAAHIDFESAREAIKRCFIECCQADKQITTLDMLKALYVAATS